LRIRFLDWPAADQAAWNAACEAAPLLENGGAGAHWRPASRAALVANYGRWLGFLKLRGWLHATEAPAERLDRERVQAFVTYLQEDCGSATIAGYIAKLVMALNGMCPEENWEWLRAPICTSRQYRSEARRTGLKTGGNWSSWALT
jgi:hypothetical protein